MRARLVDLISPDIVDPVTSTPADPTDFEIFFQALIGPDDGVGSEAFGFTLTTPGAVERRLQKEPILFGRGKMIVEYYHYPTFRSAIERLCWRTEGKTWSDVAQILNTYFHWEFD